jgi:hypothetical protein
VCIIGVWSRLFAPENCLVTDFLHDFLSKNKITHVTVLVYID